MLTIRRVKELTELEPRWNALLARSSARSFFLSWEWLSTWWRHYRTDFELLVLAAEEEGELVGIAPFMVGGGIDHLTGPARRLSEQVRFLKFLSQGPAYPEHMDLICQRGREAELTDAFARHLLGEERWAWDILSLDLQPADSPCRIPLLRALERGRARVLASVENGSPFLALPATSEAFWESRSTSFRKKWRYNDRALAKLGSVKLQFPDEAAGWPLERVFDEMLKLNDARWGDRNQSFIEPRFVAFHRELCRVAHSKGMVLLCLLTLDEKPVAARYDFIYGGKAWSYQGGWSQELAKLSVGNTFLGRVIEHCVSQGLGEYDFLTGEHAYKRHWAGEGERALVNLVANNPFAVRGWLYAAARVAQGVVRDRIIPSLPEALRARLSPGDEHPAPSGEGQPAQ